MKLDVSRFTHLGSQEESSGQKEGYCPCGKSPDKCSLGVKRDGNYILYNCFAVSCSGFSGKIRVDTSSFEEKAPQQDKRKIEFMDLSNKFPENESKWLEQFGIGKRTKHRYKIKWSNYWKRIVFPIYDETGYLLANTARSNSHPIKWLHDRRLGEICYTSKTSAAITTRHGKVGVIVEDPLSAIVAGNLTPSLALLGTQYKTKLNSIKEWVRFNKIECVYCCLDLDAWDKNIEFVKWLNINGVRAIPKRIDQDMKWMTDAEILEVVKDG